MYNERDILTDLGNGDTYAFDLLYMLYAPKIELFIVQMVKNQQDAEDLTHNIFLKVWKNRSTIAQVDSFKSYIFKMAKNAVFDFYSHNVIRERYKQAVQRKKSLIPEIYYMEQELDAQDLSILIDMAIDKMPQKRKSVFLMSREDGLSHKAIAEKLKISYKTVENHISQALNMIRKNMS